MKIKVSELPDSVLDLVVAKGIYGNRTTRHGEPWFMVSDGFVFYYTHEDDSQMSRFHPSTNRDQGLLIIEQENISLHAGFVGFVNSTDWEARTHVNHELWEKRFCGKTPLIAGMRCYGASKFGEEIDIPEELFNSLLASGSIKTEPEIDLAQVPSVMRTAMMQAKIDEAEKRAYQAINRAQLVMAEVKTALENDDVDDAIRIINEAMGLD